MAGLEGTFGLTLVSGSGSGQHLSCVTRDDRDNWRDAIQSASHFLMRQRLAALRDKVTSLTRALECSDTVDNVTTDSTVIQTNTPAVMECSFSCDNLLCDALGRSPSPRLLVYLRNSDTSDWRLYSSTETVEVIYEMKMRFLKGILKILRIVDCKIQWRT